MFNFQFKVSPFLFHIVYKSALKSAEHFFESHFWSFSHSDHQSLSHPVTLSLCHLVTRSLGHSVTWLFGHLVTQSLIFLLVIPEWPADGGVTDVTSDQMIEWPSDRVTGSDLEWPGYQRSYSPLVLFVLEQKIKMTWKLMFLKHFFILFSIWTNL